MLQCVIVLLGKLLWKTKVQKNKKISFIIVDNPKSYLMLICRIVPKEDRPWHVVYDFVADRIRAIRQDMVIQRLCGMEACMILMKCVRFYLYANYR